jgi:hypothetical protein
VSSAARSLSNQFHAEWLKTKVDFCVHKPARMATKQLHVVSLFFLSPGSKNSGDLRTMRKVCSSLLFCNKLIYSIR